MKAKGYSTIAGLEKLTPEEIKARNLETYGLKIKTFRIRAGLTAEQLAETLGISKSSVRNWECGLTRPDPEFLYRMFTILRVEPNEFFGIKGIGGALTKREQALIDGFRTLDEPGKDAVETLTAAMGERTHLRRLKAARDRMNSVVSYGRMAAAGDGTDWPEHPEVEPVVLYDSYTVAEADEVITVTGASMEPQFYSGDRVLVKYCTDLKNGDIGIFYVPGFGGVIKQKAYDRLHSLNEKFDDIFPYEEGARLVGRVLGKIEDGMEPGPEEAALYREAMATLPAE